MSIPMTYVMIYNIVLRYELRLTITTITRYMYNCFVILILLLQQLARINSKCQ